jgi:hypothetical protein
MADATELLWAPPPHFDRGDVPPVAAVKIVTRLAAPAGAAIAALAGRIGTAGRAPVVAGALLSIVVDRGHDVILQRKSRARCRRQQPRPADGQGRRAFDFSAEF